MLEFMNHFKTAAVRASRQQQQRMSILQEELDNFWGTLTLGEMGENDYIVNFIVQQLLQPCINTRKVIYEAYMALRVGGGEEKPLLYAYDCKMFRAAAYSKEENEFISSFLLVYTEGAEVTEPIYQLVDSAVLQPRRWVLLVKESAILRVYSHVRETITRMIRHSSDKIVLSEAGYLGFMQEWIKYYYNYNLDAMASAFFRGILILLENQVMLAYSRTLSAHQRHQKMYQRPIITIPKPKNVSQATTTSECRFGDVDWDSLRVNAFALKYAIKEDEQCYECYRVEEMDEGGSLFQELSFEDQHILNALQKYRNIEEEYGQQFIERLGQQ